MKELETVIASNIIELRTKAGLTQLELAQMLNYSDKSVSKWERAESVPDVLVLKKMADIFGVTVDYILTQHDPTEKPTIMTTVRALPFKIITSITIVGIWILALLVFIIVWLCGSIVWLVFVYAVPVSLITLLILHSIWEKGKYNFYIVSLLVLSVIATIYLTFLEKNWWQLFLLAVPAEIEVFLSFYLRKKRKQSQNM